MLTCSNVGSDQSRQVTHCYRRLFKLTFLGACGLVLLDNWKFANGLGMMIHVRTKQVNWWSYIETAVLKIGNETLEVPGGEDGFTC